VPAFVPVGAVQNFSMDFWSTHVGHCLPDLSLTSRSLFQRRDAAPCLATQPLPKRNRHVESLPRGDASAPGRVLLRKSCTVPNLTRPPPMQLAEGQSQ
jgi:hypothetical protein